jgi:uncharacterized protein YlxW (UPF0749 family)
MQEKELNCASIEGANNRDISGWVTAYKIYRGFRTTKTSNLWRSTFLGSLQSQVNSLQTANTGLQNEIKTLRTQLAAV